MPNQCKAVHLNSKKQCTWLHIIVNVYVICNCICVCGSSHIRQPHLINFVVPWYDLVHSLRYLVLN